eukprot:950900-Pleurochrysis_carterae.AAC.8
MGRCVPSIDCAREGYVPSMRRCVPSIDWGGGEGGRSESLLASARGWAPVCANEREHCRRLNVLIGVNADSGRRTAFRGQGGGCRRERACVSKRSGVDLSRNMGAHGSECSDACARLREKRVKLMRGHVHAPPLRASRRALRARSSRTAQTPRCAPLEAPACRGEGRVFTRGTARRLAALACASLVEASFASTSWRVGEACPEMKACRQIRQHATHPLGSRVGHGARAHQVQPVEQPLCDALVVEEEGHAVDVGDVVHAEAVLGRHVAEERQLVLGRAGERLYAIARTEKACSKAK